MLFTSQTMLGKVKRLIGSQRLELVSKSTQPNHPTNKSTKHRTTVRSEAAVRKVCAKREVTRRSSALMSEDTHKKVSASVRRFTELDGKVFLWINNMHRANCPFHLH